MTRIADRVMWAEGVCWTVLTTLTILSPHPTNTSLGCKLMAIVQSPLQKNFWTPSLALTCLPHSTRLTVCMIDSKAGYSVKGGWKIRIFIFYFLFFGVGKGGNASCTVTPKGAVCGTLHQGLPLGLFACWTYCPVFYPLKPTPATVLAPSRYV